MLVSSDSLIPHALWHPSGLYVWAERPAPGSSPFALPPELRALIGELSTDALLCTVASECSARLSLPTDASGQPIPSPWRRPNADPPAEWRLQAHAVPCLCFGPAPAFDWLLSLPPQFLDSASDTLRFWHALARFAARMLGQHQFAGNMLEQSPGRYAAHWRMVIQDNAEVDWLERLTAAMPPACHALQRDDAPAEAAQLVEAFFAAVIDAVIRRSVADDPFFAGPAQRATEINAPMETRWLAGLLGPDPAVPGGPEENAVLAQMVDRWVSPLDESRASAMRMRFILREPPEEDHEEDFPPLPVLRGRVGEGVVSESATSSTEPPSPPSPGVPGEGDDATKGEVVWRLDLQLESLLDDDQRIDAIELFHPTGASNLLGRNLKLRRHQFFSELNRAVPTFPPAADLLQHPEPTGLDLTTAQASAFIRQWAQMLLDAGFAVQLPDWARRGGTFGLRLAVQPLDDLDDLDDADFDPTLQPSARKKNRRGPADISGVSSGHFALDALLRFDWQVAVGDLRLSAEEFGRLAQQQSPLVRYRGQWIQLDPEQARRATEFVQQQRQKEMTLGQALRTAYGASEAETGLPILGLSGADWIEQLLEQTPTTGVQAVPQPPTFNGELRPYQLRGLHWLTFLDRLGIGACLADDMGLGKTIQFIALLLHERELPPLLSHSVSNPVSHTLSHLPAQPPSPPSPGVPGEGAVNLGPTLLFAPTSVVGNWVRELERFAKPLRVLVHHGPERLTGEAFITAAREADIVITTYALAHRDREDLQKVPWRRLALDEAQKVKNPAAAATLAIRSLAAGRRVALTGTPIENHLSELWSIMEVLNPGLLPPAAEFRERFAVPIEKLGDREKSDRLRKMVRPFILRRLKSDPDIAGDLPAKMEMRVFCNLTPEQAATYERLVADSMEQIDAATGIRRRGLILSVLTRLKQVCDHPVLLKQGLARPQAPGRRSRSSTPRLEGISLDGRSGKCERLVEMLEEVIEENDAALVFTQFREMGHILQQMIAQRLGVTPLYLHGGTPARDRDAMIQRFQSRMNASAQPPPLAGVPGAGGSSDAPPIFILSLRAGGLGLNLTAANHVFHFDRWWNPAVEQQATDRAHRVGQTRNVQVHKFVCIGTMEERIDRLLTEKLALADRIIGSGDEWLTNFTTDQLREYLSLSKDAVGEF